MRLALTGAQNVGKSTLIHHFLAQWPMYSLPEKSYRDLIKEKNLAINEAGNLESQKIIRDVLVDLALDNAGKTNTLHDRCVLDNLAYSLWLMENGKLDGGDEDASDFLATSIFMVKESMKFYDVIFWVPINAAVPLVEAENRSINVEYRQEIDNIFHGIYEHYKSNNGLLFDKENQPVIIPLEGELYQRIETIKQYIGPDGKLIENETSALTDLQTAYEEDQLRRMVR